MNEPHENTQNAITKEQEHYIRKVSLKTLVNFFSAEIIGFGFGVPVAVVIAISYGNVADIFMDVYFTPVLFTTIFVVLFVAFPTNVFLTRKLIKVILKPTIDNLKEFSYSTPRIPLYAAINLFFRITIGGLIADIWGLMTHTDVSVQTFIALFVSPTFGAWTASLIYFFVLQNILGHYNIQIGDFIKIERKSEIVKYRRLSMKSIYPLLITITFLMSSLLISSDKLLGAGILGQILIIAANIVVLSILFLVSHITMKKVLNSINNMLLNWKEKREKMTVFSMYDIEDVIRDVNQLSDISSAVDKILEKTLEDIENIPDRIISSSKTAIFSLENFKNKILNKNIPILNLSNTRKNIYKYASLSSELNSKLTEIQFKTEHIKKTFSKNLSSNLKEISENIKNIKDSLKTLYDNMSSMSRFLSKIEESTSYMIKTSNTVITSSLNKIERLAKEIEMIFINFQLEMAKVGYPGEFKFISIQFSKILNRMMEISKIVNYNLSEFENNIANLSNEIKKAFISYDSEVLKMSDIVQKIETILDDINKTKSKINQIHNLADQINLVDKFQSQKLVDQLNETSLLLSKISTDDKTIENETKLFVSKIQEAQKEITSIIETIITTKKLISSSDHYVK